MSDNNFSLSRVEEILKAALEDTPYGKVPQSRVEYLLLELISKGGGGGSAGGYKPSGNAYFADLPSPSEPYLGYVYNMLEDFTTTADFLEGAGKSYPAGSNIAIVDIGSAENPQYKYDVLAGFIDVSDYITDDDLITSLSDYVEKEQGKTLSSNDYTDEEKQKVANAESDISDIQSVIPQSATPENPLATTADVDEQSITPVTSTTSPLTNSAGGMVQGLTVYGASEVTEDGIKSVWDAGGTVETTGKNLLEITAETQTVNGVTFTVDKTTGMVTANGTASKTNTFIEFNANKLHKGSYVASGIENGSISTYFLLINYYDDNGDYVTNQYIFNSGTPVQYSQYDLTYRFYVIPNQTVSNLVIKPMLCTAADYEADSSFQPYLSTSATFNHTLRGIDDLRDKLTVTQSGGEVTAKCGEVDLGDFDYNFYENLGFFIATSTLNDCVFTGKNYGVNALCSNYNVNATATTDKMSDMDLIVGNNSRIESAASLAIKDSRYTDATTFKAAVTGVKLVYPLATETVTPLTSTELAQFRNIRTFSGTTNITITDEPDYSVDYLKNTDNGQAVADIQAGLQEQLDSKITVSPLLTLTAEGWDSTTKQQTVTFAHDTSRMNIINVDTASLKLWAAAGVYAVSETADSITFECSSIPESALSFRVTSMEVTA